MMELQPLGWSFVIKVATYYTDMTPANIISINRLPLLIIDVTKQLKLTSCPDSSSARENEFQVLLELLNEM